MGFLRDLRAFVVKTLLVLSLSLQHLLSPLQLGGAFGGQGLGGIGADMGLAAQPGQFHLLFPLHKTGFLGIGSFIVTMRTADALLVLVAGFVGLGNRQATGVALVVMAFFKLQINCYPFVKNKTFAFPQGFLCRYDFQVF
jgi:hypothetical protein